MTRSRFGWWKAGAAVALVTALLSPAPSRAAARQVKVAVLDVKADGEVDPKAVSGLSSVIASTAASRRDLSITSGADLRALLNFDKQKHGLGCTDQSCLAEIGGALGVQFLVASEVSRVGKIWLLSMTLLETGKAKARSRLTRQAETPDALVKLAEASTRALLREIPSPDGAPPVVAEPAPEPPTGRTTAGWVLGGAGLALAGAATWTGLTALSHYDDQKAAGAAGDAAGWESHRSSVGTYALATDVLAGAAIVGVGTGLYLLLTGGDSAEPQALSFGVAPGSNAAYAFLSGEF